jgi:hypothetical protein
MGRLSPFVNTLRRTPPLVFAMAVLATGLVVASSVLVWLWASSSLVKLAARCGLSLAM